MSRKLFVAFLILISACTADAARKRVRKEPKEDPQVSFDFRLDSFAFGQYRELAGSVINPGNNVLKIPTASGLIDLRPEFRAGIYDDRVRATVRPRLIAQYDSVETITPETKTDSETEVTIDLTDAYIETRITDSVRLTAGLEVYQWGPSELYNASNPLFHLRTASRSAFFKEKGEVLVRLGFDATPNWNTMLIANPVSNNEPSWRSGDTDFNANCLIKSEITAENPANYIGLVGGVQPDARPFFGEYFNYGWESGFSVYLDSRHPIGRKRFTPTLDPLFNIELASDEDSSTIETLGILGVRWEGAADIRLEYLYNSQGYSLDEFELALDSLRAISIYLPTNYARFLQPGLELLGQHILYFSVRVSDIGPSDDASVFLRSLFSLQDNSATLQLATEKPLSDSLVLNIEGNFAFGEENSEFTLVDRAQGIIGIKWTL